MGRPKSGDELDALPPGGVPSQARPSVPAAGVRRPRPRWLVVGAAALVWAGLLLTNHVASLDRKVDEPAAVGEGDEPAPAGWRRGAIGPLRSRTGQVEVWTGRELVIWGGEPDGDGAAYDPVTQVWRPMAPAPMAAPVFPAAAFTGNDVIIWGGQTSWSKPVPVGEGAAYNVSTDRWRSLPASPLSPRRPLAGVWTEREFVVVGGVGEDGALLQDAAAYDPVSGGWRPIAALPVALEQAAGVWTGDELILVGVATASPRSVAAAWHPSSNQWRLIPTPLEGRRVTAVWDGRHVVAWDSDLRSARLDVATREWQKLNDLPSVPGLCDPEGARAVGLVLAETCGQAAILSSAEGRWKAVPHPRFLSGRPVWTGRDLMWWTGAFHGSKDSIWLYDPPASALRPSLPKATGPRVPVGTDPACRLTIDSRSDPPQVPAGSEFVWTLTVSNPSPCSFGDVTVADFITTSPGFGYWLVSYDPPVSAAVALHSFSKEGYYTNVTWEDVGPLRPGASSEIRFRVRLSADAPPGHFVTEPQVTATIVDGARAAGGPERVEVRSASESPVILGRR